MVQIDAIRIAGRPVPSDFYKKYNIPRSAPRSSVVQSIDLAWANVKNVFTGGAGLSRFSAGLWPVLYTACEQLTAIYEKGFWIDALIFKKNNKPSEVLCIEYKLRLSGNAKDYLGKEREMPLLVHPTDYTFCHALAEAAFKEKLDFLFVPSARRFGGRNVPVFERSAIQEITNATLSKYVLDNTIINYECNNGQFEVKVDDVFKQISS